MIIKILIIIIIFAIAFVSVWLWFLKNEITISKRLYSSGLKAYEAKSYKKAEKLFLQALAVYSHNKEARYYLGLTYIELKEYADAKDCFERILKTSPQNFDILYNLGLSLFELKLYKEAFEIYQKALKENPASGSCLFKLGLIKFEQAEYNEALEYFKKARELSPNKVEITFYITKCKDELCPYDTVEEGQDIINEYLSISDDPNLPPEFDITLATAYAKTGQMKDALEGCRKSLVKTPETVECYKLLGLIQLLCKDLDGVKNSLSTAINLQADNSELHEILSYALCQQDNRCAVNKCRKKYKELIQKFIK